MLMARLDRLEGAKEVAQIASVIGNEFSWRLLREVAPIEEETLRVELKKLVDSELLFEQGSAPSTRYTIQARAHSGRRLSIAGEKQTAAIPPPDRPDA